MSILATIAGMRSDLLNRIEKVNTRIDQTSGPTNIADYMVWNEDNPATWEHPGYTDTDHTDTMEELATANTTKEAKHLKHENYYRSLLTQYVAECRLQDLTDDAYIDK